MTALQLTYMAGEMIGVDGQPLACPDCAETIMLSVTADLVDRSGDPSMVTCPFGHAWAAANLPRHAVADLLLAITAHARDDWEAALREMREHGTLILPAMTLRLLAPEGPSAS